MKFSYNWLKDYFKKELPKPQKLAEILTMRAFEVEGVEKKRNDWLLDIDILPNRAHDCLSHIGIAREIGAVLNLKPKFPKISIQKKEGKEAKKYLRLEIKDKENCLRYTAKIIKGVKVKPSPKWLRERLEICGLNSINNVVDITNYVMLETGQPLHAFDLDKISDSRIIVRKAEKGEKITTLDNKSFDLDGDILIIADSKDPLAIAGIKGGKKAEIDEKTKNIVLESANFSSKSIRKTRQKLSLTTDASLRFEHQPDPNLTALAIERAGQLIKEVGGGKIVEGLLDFYPQKLLPRRIKLEKEKISKLLGRRIPEKDINKILKRLEFKILKNEKNFLLVEIPTFRQDILIPEDLIEEIGRIFGYEKISNVLPMAKIYPPARNDNIFWEEATKEFFKEMGFTEVYNYSFISENDLRLFHFKEKNILELKNPLSREFKYLRPSLIPNLLKNIQKNQNYFSKIKIFELGKIFKNEDEKEKRKLSGIISIEKKYNKNNELFFEAKGIIDTLFNNLAISDSWYDDYLPKIEEGAIWSPKKCAEVKVGDEKIGLIGEISKEILKEFKINLDLIAFDFNFEKLQRMAQEEQEFRPISPYPAAVRDIAVLVPKETRVIEVLDIINRSGGKLVRDIDLFDIYEGEEIPEGKKNFAFHIIFQSEVKTLSSKDLDKIQRKIIKELEKNPEWEVRKQ